tara:strand:+ start:886 stop:1071 length:186 start_codon:yes stop_codon:yes gene_type:complete
MSKYLTIFFLFFSILSCGYPDIDDVPDFKDTKLNDEELLEYCSISNTEKIDIDKCINDYKS